jgi:hypothetical protein
MLYSRKLLTDAHRRIFHLYEGKVLSKADLRTTVEGDVSPRLGDPVVFALFTPSSPVWSFLSRSLILVSEFLFEESTPEECIRCPGSMVWI